MQLADGDTPPATAPRRGPRRRRAAGSRALVRARRRSAPRGQRALPVGVRLTHRAINRVVAPSNRVHNTPMELRPATDADVADDRAVARRQLEPQLPRRLFGRVPRPRGARRAIERVDRDALPTRAPDQRTVLAVHDGELVGFVHTVLDDDPQWGALLDNLHVRADWQRRRLGSQLVAASAGRRRRAPRPRPLPLGARGQRPRPPRSTPSAAAKRSSASRRKPSTARASPASASPGPTRPSCSSRPSPARVRPRIPHQKRFPADPPPIRF